jgi:hypothetical protein
MRILISKLCILAFHSISYGQGLTYKVTTQALSTKLGSFDMSAPVENWVEVENVNYPEHHDKNSVSKMTRNFERFGNDNKLNKNQYLSTPKDLQPDTGRNFNGLPIGSAGIPNDNNIAISNDGTIVSVINSSVTMLRSDGSLIRYRTLRTIVNNVLPNLDRTYDPKIVYDPYEDKFILVFLQGSLSADSRIIVGFSETNNPDGIWNFYAIEGNPFTGKTWSDYPIIAINNNDLYITVNILRDNESWQEGFVQSVIWQVNKENGYKGDTLVKRLFYDLKFNGSSIWSICPISPTVETNDDGMYLLSVRPSALENDTLFIHRIVGNAKSSTIDYSLFVAKANLKYGVPPSAYQPSAGFRLQTNDTRVLSGFYTKDHFQYVQSTYVPISQSSGLFHGIGRGLHKKEYQVVANYIYNDSFDMAYPSIVSTASEQFDASSVMTASYSSKRHYPGTLAIHHNQSQGLPSIYSVPVIVKKGEGLINTFLVDSIERWGDYTAIQSKYNEKNKVWLCGSYGMASSRNGVWIGEVNINNELSVLVNENKMSLGPNPNSGNFFAYLDIKEAAIVEFSCISREGKQVLANRKVELYQGTNHIRIDLTGVAAGIYIIRAHNKSKDEVFSEKVVIQ